VQRNLRMTYSNLKPLHIFSCHNLINNLDAKLSHLDAVDIHSKLIGL
jgi:hypothetical protein